VARVGESAFCRTPRRNDGSTVPAEITVTPIYARESWLSGVVSVIRDVSRKKKHDEVRRRNQQRLRFILDQVPAIVWTTDHDLKITSLMGHQRNMLSDDTCEGSPHSRDSPPCAQQPPAGAQSAAHAIGEGSG
jgi:hypothetical protein